MTAASAKAQDFVFVILILACLRKRRYWRFNSGGQGEASWTKDGSGLPHNFRPIPSHFGESEPAWENGVQFDGAAGREELSDDFVGVGRRGLFLSRTFFIFRPNAATFGHFVLTWMYRIDRMGIAIETFGAGSWEGSPGVEFAGIMVHQFRSSA